MVKYLHPIVTSQAATQSMTSRQDDVHLVAQGYAYIDCFHHHEVKPYVLQCFLAKMACQYGFEVSPHCLREEVDSC